MHLEAQCCTMHQPCKVVGLCMGIYVVVHGHICACEWVCSKCSVVFLYHINVIETVNTTVLGLSTGLPRRFS